MLGGIGIRFAKPQARTIAIYLFVVEIISMSGLFGAMLLHCPTPQLTQPSSSCNLDCACSPQVYQPVCGSDRATNYFSPCFAGCQSYDNEQKVCF